MNKYQIVRISGFLTLKGLMKKTEKYINAIEHQGKQEVISVSFDRGVSIVTLKLK